MVFLFDFRVHYIALCKAAFEEFDRLETEQLAIFK
jgi:hypothetical protein